MPRLLPALAACVLLVASCATPSFDASTGRLTSVPASPILNAHGARMFRNYQKRHTVSTDSGHHAKAQRVVDRLATVIPPPDPDPWEVVVFDEKEPNAFALPGGKIGVHTGIFPLTRDDAGMATVLAHEMAHISLNHSQAKLNRVVGLTVGALVVDAALQTGGAVTATRIAAAGAYGAGSATGVFLPHSRRYETEADQLGMLYMARAGYDPGKAVEFWHRFADWRKRSGKRTAPEFFRTHPLDDTRIRALEDYLPVARREYQAHP